MRINIVNGHVDKQFQMMSNELTSECNRLKAWGVLGQGLSGRLVQPGSREVNPGEQLVCECYVRFGAL